jgi:diguanylate cyclase (GGDEF)-like protein
VSATWWRGAALAILAIVAVGSTARAQQGAVAAADAAVDADIARCFELRQSAPREAVVLAERLLGGPDLDPGNRIKAWSCLGRAAAYGGDTARALESAAQIDMLLEAHPMPPGFELRAVSNAGAILHVAGQVDAALDAYGRAHALAQAEDAAETQLVTLVNIGSIHSEELRAYDAAEDFYQEALAIAEAAGLDNASLPYNRGQNFVRMGRPAEAAPLFDAAATVAARDGDRVLELRARAERLALPDAPPEAPARLAALAESQLALPDVGGAAITLTALARLSLARGETQAALARASRAAGLVQDGHHRRERIDALEARLAALEALGRSDEALAVARELRAFETALLRAQRVEALAGLQASLEDGARSRELAHLRATDHDRGVALERTRLLRNSALLGLVLLALGTLAFAFYQRRIRRRLETLSTVDPLTGLLNRRAASARLMQAPFPCADAPTGDDGRRATLFLVDIDHFKAVNDRLGHGAGDAVLVEVARRLTRGCRPGDLVSRWGGEEFLVACPCLDLDGAVAIAKRLRASVAEGIVDVDGSPVAPPNLSVGFACWPFFPTARQTVPPGSWQDAVAIADRALYAVKRSGRDGWIGLWGNSSGGDVVRLLQDPAAAIERGEVTVAPEDLPVTWPAPVAPDAGDGTDPDRPADGSG